MTRASKQPDSAAGGQVRNFWTCDTARWAGTWSGFYELGTFNLSSSSEFRITGWVASTEYVTSGVWQFTPTEAPLVIPGPAGLGLMGLALLAVRRRRS